MKEVRFKDGNINDLINAMKESVAGMLEVSKDKVKLAGIRFYFVDEEHDILQTTDLFSKDFNLEDYEGW